MWLGCALDSSRHVSAKHRFTCYFLFNDYLLSPHTFIFRSVTLKRSHAYPVIHRKSNATLPSYYSIRARSLTHTPTAISVAIVCEREHLYGIIDRNGGTLRRYVDFVLSLFFLSMRPKWWLNESEREKTRAQHTWQSILWFLSELGARNEPTSRPFHLLVLN